MSAGSRESQSPALAIVTVPPFWVDGLKTLSTPALKPVVPPPLLAGVAELALLAEPPGVTELLGLALFLLLLPHAVSTSAATAETATTAVIGVLLIVFLHPYFSW